MRGAIASEQADVRPKSVSSRDEWRAGCHDDVMPRPSDHLSPDDPAPRPVSERNPYAAKARELAEKQRAEEPPSPGGLDGDEAESPPVPDIDALPLPPDAVRRFRIACSPGLPSHLANELRSLDFAVLAEHRAGVETEGTREEAMMLALHLRTALHILEPLAAFRCSHPDELYRRIAAIPWEAIISPDGYVCVTSNVNTPSIDNTMFANLRVKDAIVDRIQDARGRRPDSGPDRTGVVVHLYWVHDDVVISLNLTGEKLADRGYRRRPHAAPMQESLAAACVLATGYQGNAPAVMPMCGSGTLAIEAALIGTGRPPGLLRTRYAFMNLLDFDADSWQGIRAKALGRHRTRQRPNRIIATDHDPKAVEAAQANAQTAGVDSLIEFNVCDFTETDVPDPGDTTGILIMNPEYGLRMGDVRALESTYGQIGDFFKQRCPGYNAFLFTGNLDLAKRVGLKASRRMPFWNADIECRLLKYEIYRGSRREIAPASSPPGE